ncbi:MAG: lipid-A-disaccharide synthase N-terminal domain-containing protein [Planctomycetes bacterium]|nr:lipid-A-disaccharide synthase N-terminal domain-containing protein [Planctomycetota bacterium]
MAQNLLEHYWHGLLANLNGWELLALVGQTAFSTRFLVQWVASEKQKKSVIPDAFWYLSLVGGTLLLIYAFGIRRPVLILGFLFNNVVYWRNLVLIRRHRREEAAAATVTPPGASTSVGDNAKGTSK